MKKEILKKSFEEFSTSDAWVLISLINSDTGEQIKVVLPNSYWHYTASKKELVPKEAAKYTEYMLRNSNRIFDLKEADFRELAKFKAGTLFSEDSLLEKSEIINKYFTKENQKYRLIDTKFNNNFDFYRMLIESDFTVRTSCFDGSLYLENFN